MRRIILILFLFSISIGILSPISFSLTQQAGQITVGQTTTYWNLSVKPNIAAAATSTSSASASNQGVWGAIGSCGVVFGSMSWCLAYIFYFIPFYVGGQLLDMAAKFMDITASLTLSSSMFSGGFLQTGWGILRDFANIFFIFILLYIALATILDINTGDSKGKMVVSVVLIALFINFSMFVTDAIIDLSNITALVFYNQIGVKDSTGATSTTPSPDEINAKKSIGDASAQTEVPPKDIGIAIASNFHPQLFADKNFWNSISGQNSGSDAGTVIIIEIVMGVLYAGVAYSFFVTAFSFIGRMIELWILIIVSPVAFISYIVPSMRNSKKLENMTWTKWWSHLTEVAFAAPIYFFLLLVIAMMMQALFAKAPVLTAGDWMVTLLGSVILPAIMIWTFIMKATKFAEKASGELGEKLGKLAGTAVSTVGMGALSIAGAGAAGAGKLVGGAALTGVKAVGSAAGGAVSGAAAWAGRNTIGRLGANIESGLRGKGKNINENMMGGARNKLAEIGQNANIGGWLARGSKRVLDKTADITQKTRDAVVNTAGKAGEASFDPRHSKAGKWVQEQTGMSFGSWGPLAAKNTVGGFKNENTIKKQRAADVQEKHIKALGYDKDQVQDINDASAKKDEEIADKTEEAVASNKELEKAAKDLETASTALKNMKVTFDPKTVDKDIANREADLKRPMLPAQKDAIQKEIDALKKAKAANDEKDSKEAAHKTNIDALHALKNGVEDSKRTTLEQELASGKSEKEARAAVMAQMSPQELKQAAYNTQYARVAQLAANQLKKKDKDVVEVKDKLGNVVSVTSPNSNSWNRDMKAIKRVLVEHKSVKERVETHTEVISKASITEAKNAPAAIIRNTGVKIFGGQLRYEKGANTGQINKNEKPVKGAILQTIKSFKSNVGKGIMGLFKSEHGISKAQMDQIKKVLEHHDDHGADHAAGGAAHDKKPAAGGAAPAPHHP